MIELSRCVCGGVVRDHDADGIELADGRRFHIEHLPEPVARLWNESYEGPNDTAWDRAVVDFDRYVENGGRHSFTVWAERYAEYYTTGSEVRP